MKLSLISTEGEELLKEQALLLLMLLL